MARGPAPLWLSQPSRFAGMRPLAARWAAAGLIVLLAATFLAFAPGNAPLVNHDPARSAGQLDIVLYQSIVEGVRQGGNYYAVAADTLRAGEYPLRPFITFRLPTLAMIEAILPPWAITALLFALVAGVFVAWFLRLRPAFTRAPPLALALLLLIGGLMVFLQPQLAAFHEIWAGLLIALGLAVRKPGHWIEAVALGLIAMLIRETAALYVALMLILAVVEGQRREAAGWFGALAIFAIVIAFHAHAVAQVIHPGDPASPGWAGMLGFGFFVRTMVSATALTMAPLWLAAPLVGLALFGWASWRDLLGLRVLTVIAGYAVLLGLFGRADTFYWGLMVAPTLLVGLSFAPDGLRDLVTALRTRPRRIVVRRVSP
jgi:hypothetical protein